MHAEALLVLGREHGIALLPPMAKFFLGWTRWHSGDWDGEREMGQGLELVHKNSQRYPLPLFGTLLAEVDAELGWIEAGLAWPSS